MGHREETNGPVHAAPSSAAADVLEAPDHDVRAVLAITTFRRLWLALTFSSFGDWLGLLATISMAAALAGDNTAKAGAAVSGTLIMRLLPSLVLGPVAGALADRFDRRWTMVVGDLIRFALFASIPLVGTMAWLFAATLLIECAALVWGPAKEATVPNLVPRKRLEAANQVSLAATYGTAPIAALAYSALALLTGIVDNYVTSLRANPVDLALYVNALSFLVSAVTISRLKLPNDHMPSHTEAAPPLWRSMLDGWRFVGGTPVVRGLVLGMLGAFAAAGLVIGPARQFVHSLHAGDPGYGLLFGAVFIGLALGMWLGPRFLPDLSRRRLFGLSLCSAGALLAALALTPNIVIATMLTIGVGAFGGLAWVTGYTLLGLVVDDEVRGRTFGFLQSSARMVLVLVLALAPPLAGIVGDHTIRFTPKVALTYSGAAVLYFVAGAVALALGVAAFRQMDDRRGIPLRRDLVAAWKARMTATGGIPVLGGMVPGHGVFIAFEGGDGVGKSTQARMLAHWLREDGDHDVLLTREPGGSDAGVALADLLLKRHDLDPRAEALIFAADRAQHVATVVRPALRGGAIVVSDRYVDSSIAYQAAGALDPAEVERLSAWATGGLLPDLTIVLDLPEQEARHRRESDDDRGAPDRIESSGDEFHGRVRATFLDLAARAPHRYLVLDAATPVDELQELIRDRVRQVVPVSPRRREQLIAAMGVPAGHVEPSAHASAPVSAPVTTEPPAGPSDAPRTGDRSADRPAGPPSGPPAGPALPMRPEELLTVPIPLGQPEMGRPFVRLDGDPAAGAAPAAPFGPAPASVPGGERPSSRRSRREQEQRARTSGLADPDEAAAWWSTEPPSAPVPSLGHRPEPDSALVWEAPAGSNAETVVIEPHAIEEVSGGHATHTPAAQTEHMPIAQAEHTLIAQPEHVPVPGAEAPRDPSLDLDHAGLIDLRALRDLDDDVARPTTGAHRRLEPEPDDLGDELFGRFG